MKKEKWRLVSPDSRKTEIKENITFSGVANITAKTFLISSQAPLSKRKRAFFWCARDTQEKQDIIANLEFWQSFLKAEFPIFDFENIEGDFLSSLFNIPFVAVATPEDLLKKLPAPDDFEKSFLSLKTEEPLNPGKLAGQLIKMGYEFQQFASKPGIFARKGGIVDVFPQNYQSPLKIEFSGSQIESVALTDVKTKRHLKRLKEVEIIPARLDYFSSKSTIFDYLNQKTSEDVTFIYSDPDSFFEVSLHWQELQEKIRKFKSIVFESLESKKVRLLDFRPAERFRNNLSEFAERIKDFQKRKYEIIIATGDRKAVKNILKEKGVKENLEFIDLPNEKIHGFYSLSNKLLLLTDLEIFGKVKQEEGSKKRVNINLIYELRKDDFVVHLDHGIARFKGIVKQKTNGQEREYFSLEYAEKDKLYLPIEYAEKISKYIGEAEPKLHRLSSTSFRQLTNKIKKSAEKTAHELLRLYALRETAKTVPLKAYLSEEKELESSFKFTETPDQEKVILEVLSDLSKSKPTDRLICGDVGFGKTEVAVRAALRAILNKKQVILLSPTTLLTQQHFDTFKSRFASFPVNIAILSRVDSKKRQKEVISALKNGLIDIVIGTHRLLSPDVQFKNLGLIIIDEEQRFGVKDKEKLKSLRQEAHILTLSATPIPRTLNFSLAGLRDISVINTPPKGRQSIETIISPYSDDVIKKAILEEIKRKGQVYFLHNRVETINLKANQLKKMIPEAKIGVVHGRLKEKDLMEEMKKFDNQKTNLLVCSTIIENGLDLPNANTLIVENATRFGLADLYQLRGRIGRSHKKACAYFLYHSKKLKMTARKRLKALLEAKELGSGFELALRDLEIRGSGNILGHKQSGHIKAIGLNLYLRLLNQAIEELRTGKTQKPIRDVQIDLPVSLGIPEEIIPEESKRLKIYQELAYITSEKELIEFEKKFKKKYESLPDKVKNLFKVLKLKIYAQKTSIININSSKTNIDGIKKEKIIINFLGKILPEQIERLLKINPSWDFSEEQIKIEKAALGEKWLPILIECIKIFVLS